MSLSKRVSQSHLRPEKIQARVGVRLSAIRKMLIQNFDVHFPMLVELKGKSDRTQNIEREILALRSAHVGIAINPAQSKPTERVGNQSAIRLHEVVPATEVYTEIMVLDAADDRLGQEGQ